MSRDWTREEFGITDNTPVVDIDSLERKCELLQKQLDIAKKYLKWIINTTKEGHICCDACGYQIECKGCENEEWAKDALKEIEELSK